jgi:hypothetical protein
VVMVVSDIWPGEVCGRLHFRTRRPYFHSIRKLVDASRVRVNFSLTSSLPFSLHQGDPHGALLWLDFLAIKSGNLDWIQEIGSSFDVDHLPGINLNRALARRMQEKNEDHASSDALLRDTLVRFPQVVMVLADKAGINISPSARSHPHFEMRVGYR